MNIIVNIPMVFSAMGFTYNMLNQSINNVNYNHAQYPKGDALPNSRYRTSHAHASNFQSKYYKIQSAHFMFAHHAPLLHHTVYTHTSRLYKVLRSSSFNRHTKLFSCFKFRRYAKHSS